MNKMQKNKGIIYSMDTVFAIYIVLIAISSFSIMFNYSTNFDRSDLRLSRLARDAYNIQLTEPAAQFPEEVSIDPDDCLGSSMVGHAFVLIAEGGVPSTKEFVACLVDVKFEQRTGGTLTPPSVPDDDEVPPEMPDEEQDDGAMHGEAGEDLHDEGQAEGDDQWAPENGDDVSE